MKDCKSGIPEVSLRLSNERCIRGTGETVRTPADVLQLLRKVVGADAAQESFLAVYLGAANDVLSVQRVTLGGLDQVAVDPRVVLSGALLSGAVAIIIAHNHPSGSMHPSAADDSMTQLLIDAARGMNIRLLDHLIFSDTDSYSYVQHGRLRFS